VTHLTRLYRSGLTDLHEHQGRRVVAEQAAIRAQEEETLRAMRRRATAHCSR
jgi:hypothetical protein